MLQLFGNFEIAFEKRGRHTDARKPASDDFPRPGHAIRQGDLNEASGIVGGDVFNIDAAFSTEDQPYFVQVDQHAHVALKRDVDLGFEKHRTHTMTVDFAPDHSGEQAASFVSCIGETDASIAAPTACRHLSLDDNRALQCSQRRLELVVVGRRRSVRHGDAMLAK